MGAEARLVELKLELPPAPKPVATYVTAIRHGDLMYVSGHGPYCSDGTLIIGKLGADMDVPAGQAAARQTGLAILATLKAHLGSLDKVVRLIKSLGMVNATPDFTDQPKVINGFSELMKDVFGEPAASARGAPRRQLGITGRDRRRNRGDLSDQGLSGSICTCYVPAGSRVALA